MGISMYASLYLQGIKRKEDGGEQGIAQYTIKHLLFFIAEVLCDLLP